MVNTLLQENKEFLTFKQREAETNLLRLGRERERGAKGPRGIAPSTFSKILQQEGRFRSQSNAVREALNILNQGPINQEELKKFISGRSNLGGEVALRVSKASRSKEKIETAVKDISKQLGPDVGKNILKTGLTPIQAKRLSPKTRRVLGIRLPKSIPQLKSITTLQKRKVSEPTPKVIKERRSVSEVLGLRSLSKLLDKPIQAKRKALSKKRFTLRRLLAKDRTAKDLQALSFLQQSVNFGGAIVDTPETLAFIIKNPSSLKAIPGVLKKEGKEFIKLSPEEAVVRVGTEVLLIRGTGSGISKLSKISRKGISKSTGQFLGKAKVGSEIKIPVKPIPGKLPKGKIPKKPDTIKLKVIARLPKQSIRQQVKLAGKRTTAVSTQAERLVGLINRGKVIRKPIQSEKTLPKAVKNLLRKFDKSKITQKELNKLDLLLLQLKKKGILERSFFADPKSRIRVSRLGLSKREESLLKDIFTGRITFKRAKPQILVFRKTLVQKFPKELKKVKSKLSQGKQLTKKESRDLLNFQLKKSGKFKPIGFTSRESEIVLSPGEIVKRSKKLGDIEVNGTIVPIIETKIIKATGKLKSLLKKSNRGKKLTKIENKNLNRLLKKQTGFKVRTSSSKKISKRFVDIKKSLAVSPSIRKKPKLKRPSPSITSRRKRKTSIPKSPRSRSPKSSFPRTPPRRPPKSPPRSPPISPPSKRPPGSPPGSPPSKRPPGSPSGIPPGRLKLGKRAKKKKITIKPKQGFRVLIKRRGKFMKLKTSPLTREDALDKLASILDNTLARTGKIVGAGKVKRLGRIKKREEGMFKRTKRNLRNFKIRKGKRLIKTDTFIERRGKPVINTRGEKRELRLSRGSTRRKVNRNLVPKITKRVGTKTKSSVQLMNLAKGRRILAQKRKKR